MITEYSDKKTALRFRQFEHLIGNTPMLRLNYMDTGINLKLHIKAKKAGNLKKLRSIN